jgi:hypothetical protein
MKYRFYGGPSDGREVEATRLGGSRGGTTLVPPKRVCVPAWSGHAWLQVYYERSGDVYLFIGEGKSQRLPRGD